MAEEKEIISSEEETEISTEEVVYEVDPDYEKYLQKSFQDEVVETIFYNITDYVKEHAVNLCEYMTRDDIEVIIEELSGLEML